MPFQGEFFLAWKYLKPQKTIISALTYTSLLGPMLGVGILVVVVAVMSGIPKELEKKLLEYNAHITITTDGPLNDTPRLIKYLEDKYQVKASPVTSGPFLLETKDQDSDVFVAKGIIPELDEQVSQIKKMIISESKAEYYLKPNQLIISETTSQVLNLKIGDQILLHSPEKYRALLNQEKTTEEETSITLFVAGIYSSGIPDVDNNFILTHQLTTNKLMLLNNTQATQIELAIEDPSQAIVLSKEMRQDHYLQELVITPWQQQHNIQNLTIWLNEQKQLMVFVLFFIVVGAAIGVAACLFSVVIQKTKEIGILKATGMKPTAIIFAFLTMGTSLGILGSSLGLVGGLITLHFRELLAYSLGIWDNELYKLKHVPVDYNSGEIALIFIISVLICAFASVIPATIAATINPVKALQSKG